jgi:hypothetical protein
MMSRRMTSHLSTPRNLLALTLNCIAHGEQIDSLPPVWEKADMDVPSFHRTVKKCRPFFEGTAVDAWASASEFPAGLADHRDSRNQTHRSEES